MDVTGKDDLLYEEILVKEDSSILDFDFQASSTTAACTVKVNLPTIFGRAINLLIFRGYGRRLWFIWFG